MVSLSAGQFTDVGTTSFCLIRLSQVRAFEDKRLSLANLRAQDSQRQELCFSKRWPHRTCTELDRRVTHSERCLRLTSRNSATEDPAPSSGSGSSTLKEGRSSIPESSDQNVSAEQQQSASEADARSNFVKRALDRAAEYKKRKELGLPTKTIAPESRIAQSQTQSPKSTALPSPARPAAVDSPQAEIIRPQEDIAGSKLNGDSVTNSSFQVGYPGASPASSLPTSSSETGEVSTNNSEGNEIADAVVDVKSLIEQNVAAWASNSENGSQAGSNPAAGPAAGEDKESPALQSAFEKARRYKQQTSEMVTALAKSEGKAEETSGAPAGPSPASPASANDGTMEIEIVTREGVIRRKVMNPKEQLRAFSNVKDVKKKGVTGIDFAGLGFADKKKSGSPAGLAGDGFATPPRGPLPQVEIITRDAAATGSSQAGASVETAKEAERLYKPRVSSWGVFARPADISKTYGGGRTIKPGENLETDEEKKIREARTAQLLDEYRKKIGLNVDPAVKTEAQQTYNRADGLMSNGRLTEALMLYEVVTRKMPPQSELHGLAALQAGLCLDSQSRYVEARATYEKLLNHPNARISKQARRFLFGFQAMEELKVNAASEWDATIYRKYFDAFADGYNTSYKASEEERKDNLIPFVLLFLFPFLLVASLALRNSR